MASTDTRLFVPPETVRAGNAPPAGLHQWKIRRDAEIGADPIDGEIVGIRALPIHAELSLIVVGCRGHDHPRRKHDQGLEASAVQRQILGEVPVDYGAHRSVCGVYIDRICFDRDRFRDVANVKLEVLLQIVLDVDSDSRQTDQLESALFYFHAVMSRTNTGEGVKTAVSSCHLVLQPAIDVNQTNSRIGDDGSGWIGDGTKNAGSFRLGVCSCQRTSDHEEEKCEHRSAGGGCPGHISAPRL